MTTRYRVRFSPTFHPESEIEVMFAPEGEWVWFRTPGHEERAPLSVEQGVRFLEAMEALAPDSIPDGRDGGIDGCTFRCSVQRDGHREHVFSAWSPTPQKSPAQHAFISWLHRLARDVARAPATVRALEQLSGYFG